MCSAGLFLHESSCIPESACKSVSGVPTGEGAGSTCQSSDRGALLNTRLSLIIALGLAFSFTTTIKNMDLDDWDDTHAVQLYGLISRFAQIPLERHTVVSVSSGSVVVESELSGFSSQALVSETQKNLAYMSNEATVLGPLNVSVTSVTESTSRSSDGEMSFCTMMRPNLLFFPDGFSYLPVLIGVLVLIALIAISGIILCCCCARHRSKVLYTADSDTASYNEIEMGAVNYRKVQVGRKFAWPVDVEEPPADASWV